MFQRYLPMCQFFQFPWLLQGSPVQMPIKMFFLAQLLRQFGVSLLLLRWIPAFRVRIKRHLPEPDVPQLTRSLIHAKVSCSHRGSPQLPFSGGLLIGTASIPPRDGSRCSHYLAHCTYDGDRWGATDIATLSLHLNLFSDFLTVLENFNLLSVPSSPSEHCSLQNCLGMPCRSWYMPKPL